MTSEPVLSPSASVVLGQGGEILTIKADCAPYSRHWLGFPDVVTRHADGDFFLGSDCVEFVKRGRFPSLVSRLTLYKNMSLLGFQERTTEMGHHATIFSLAPDAAYKNMDALLASFGDCTCAWNQGSFAFRVHGVELSKKLREFHRLLRLKTALVSSPVYYPSKAGVAMSVLTQENAKPMANAFVEAQHRFELTCRAKAESAFR